MYSRAHLLIRRDFERFLQNPPWGIEAHPLKEDNMFEWSARILGLKDTVWEGGIFRLYLKFNDHYNDRPPDVCFHTIPFHPNVDMITGKPCIDFLDDNSKWHTYSFTTLLLTIQAMLSNPVLEEAVNLDAVHLMVNTPHAFKQMVQDCVLASQRVEAGLSPHLDSSSKSNINKELNRNNTGVTTAARHKVRLSFEDYHSTWKGIATSKVTPMSSNPLLEEIKDNAQRQAVHFGLPLEELEQQMERQIHDYSALIYGKFNNKPKLSEDQMKQSKMDQVNKMRKIYLQPRTPTSRQNTALDGDMIQGISMGSQLPQEPWETEVDDLVAWTNKLDAESL